MTTYVFILRGCRHTSLYVCVVFAGKVEPNTQVGSTGTIYKGDIVYRASDADFNNALE